MEHHPADGADAEEVFDHELTRVLHEHGDALEEQIRTLLATGAVSISNPEVILRVKLRLPRWWQRGSLEIVAIDPISGEAKGSSSTPLGKARRNRGSLVEEITIHLASELAHGN